MALSPRRQAEKQAAIAEGVAKGFKHWVPSEWPLMDDDPEVAHLATVQGVACAYNVWQLADGNVVVTYRADGMWPHASIMWVADEPRPYVEALVKMACNIGSESGMPAEDVRSTLRKVHMCEAEMEGDGATFRCTRPLGHETSEGVVVISGESFDPPEHVDATNDPAITVWDE